MSLWARWKYNSKIYNFSLIHNLSLSKLSLKSTLLYNYMTPTSVSINPPYLVFLNSNWADIRLVRKIIQIYTSCLYAFLLILTLSLLKLILKSQLSCSYDAHIPVPIIYHNFNIQTSIKHISNLLESNQLDITFFEQPFGFQLFLPQVWAQICCYCVMVRFKAMRLTVPYETMRIVCSQD